MVLETQSFNTYNATQKVESTCSDQIEMYIDIIQIYWNMLEWLTLVLKNIKTSKRQMVALSTQATIELD
jgi:hypothetical protein